MWLSVAFPRCPRCTNNANQCYHKGCPRGGNKPLEIDSESTEVKCPSCGDHWPIWRSSYYCSCGYVFSAEEVSDEVNAIIYNAKLIAKELRRTIDTRNRISAITDKVIADVAADTIKKGFGEKVWNVLKKSIQAIVHVVKAWIGL